MHTNNTYSENKHIEECGNCDFGRYNIDGLTGELYGYCNLHEENATVEDFKKLAPFWCPYNEKET